MPDRQEWKDWRQRKDCSCKSSLKMLMQHIKSTVCLFTHVYELKTFQEDLRLEMKKPGKDGLKKTHEECLEAFTNATKKQVLKKTFLRNAGLSKCKSKQSKSESLPTHVLEKQLQEEQARREALRVEVDEMRKRAEDKEALLAMQARNNVETTP